MEEKRKGCGRGRGLYTTGVTGVNELRDCLSCEWFLTPRGMLFLTRASKPGRREAGPAIGA